MASSFSTTIHALYDQVYEFLMHNDVSKNTENCLQIQEYLENYEGSDWKILLETYLGKNFEGNNPDNLDTNDYIYK